MLDDGRVAEYFAINLRSTREARGLSQAELAQKMQDLGFAWTQATVWKMEQGHREPKLAEAVALGTALGVWSWTELTSRPDTFELARTVDDWRKRVNELSERTRLAAAAQFEAIVNLAFAVRQAIDAGLQGDWLEFRSGGWLEMTPEATVLREVLAARVEGDLSDEEVTRRYAEESNLEARILRALRDLRSAAHRPSRRDPVLRA